ncbi:MAG: type II secretion system protein [Chlamydiia bacterium]|nr:type II secretion system protein [Chlamydiia bacterium]
MSNKKKRPVTLIELLIVISVISLALSYVGIEIRKGLLEEQFSASLSCLQSKLSLVQQIVYAYDTHITLTLIQHDENISVHCDAPAQLPSHLYKIITRPTYLKQIDAFHFNGQPKQTLSLTLNPLGGAYPEGILEIKGIRSQTIYFPYIKQMSTKERNDASPYPKEVEKTPLLTA